MLMEPIEIEERKGVMVVRPEGAFAGEVGSAIKAKLRAMLRLKRYKDAPKVVFNLQNITELGAGGIEILTNTNVRVNRVGGRMAVVNVEKHIEGLIVDGNVLSVFELYDSEDSAVRVMGQ